jgi:ribosome-binding factor A
MLRRDVKDPRLGMVTISDVEVTRDLSVAKVYVSFLGQQQTVSEALKLLSGRIPVLRHELGRRMRMRTIPEVRFVHDDSIERGMQMDAVLDQIKHTTPDPTET